MVYLIVVGKSSLAKDAPDIVGQIEFSELAVLSKLIKRRDMAFLHDVACFFEDRVFSLPVLQEAQADLFTMLPENLAADERAMLHKLLAVVGYACHRQLPMFGVAR